MPPRGDSFSDNNIPFAAKGSLECTRRQIEKEDFRTCSAHHEVLSIFREGETKAGHQSILEGIAQIAGGYIPYVDIRVIGNRRDFATVRRESDVSHEAYLRAWRDPQRATSDDVPNADQMVGGCCTEQSAIWRKGK